MTLTASGLPIAFACPASEALPHEDYSSEHSQAGNERHAERETAANEGDLEALPAAVQALIGEGDQLFAELAVSYDFASGEARRLGQGIGRSYGAMESTEVPGTMDLLILNATATKAIVVDYKGHKPQDASAQLALYAIAIARIYGLDEVTTVLVPEMGKATTAVLDVFDLGDFDERLRGLHRTIKAIGKGADKLETHLRVGKHCTYCKAFTGCPSQAKLVTEMVSGAGDNRVELMLPIRDNQSAADLYDFVGRVSLLVRRANAAIYARAAEEPIKLNNGKMLGKVADESNDKLDGAKVYETLTQLYDEATAKAATKLTATKKDLGAALRKRVAKGAGAEAERKVIATLRANGGCTSKPTETIEEYTPGDMRAIPARTTRALPTNNEHGNTQPGQGQ